MEEPTITFTINERGMRAINQAVAYTLDKWTGQEQIDQEQLLALKPMFQGCVFEFEYHYDMSE